MDTDTPFPAKTQGHTHRWVKLGHLVFAILDFTRVSMLVKALGEPAGDL